MTNKKTITKTGWNLDNSYSQLPELFYTILNPSPVRVPKLIIFNYPLAESLGLNAKILQSEEGISILAGNSIPDGSIPIAQAYAGHQFGHFTMLGDGRALLIGEQITPGGKIVDIQLKGSGRTPYSRGGDGRAALGPMLREYIISEGMYGLDIPTTRSLAVVSTGEKVIRERELTGAILTRVAGSHLRVGTFQYASYWGKIEDVKILADYTLQRHFPNIKNSDDRYILLLKEVIIGQASLISKWQLVGFIHGVMNTDNMTISGETIDYGPCAFMDTYDPDTVFSSIDTYGRYAYGNQPKIASWNLTRFAETLIPLLHDDKDKAVQIAQDAILEFDELYQKNWLAGMRLKLGIFNEESQDKDLFENLLNIMYKYKADYTNTFLDLTFKKLGDTVMFGNKDFTEWYNMWQSRLKRQEETKDFSYELMKKSNPAVIPRNHRVEEALEAAVKQGDYSVMDKLLNILSNPYAHSADQAEYASLPPESTCTYKTFCGT